MAISKIKIGSTEHALEATSLVNTRYIDGVSFDGQANVTRYATCSTAANTTAKTATITSGTFSLITGARVTVKFTNANSAASPTLNVGGTGAKAIYCDGSDTKLPKAQYWKAGAVVDFVYNGTQWEILNPGVEPLSKGGTGIDLSGVPPYAIIRATSDLSDYPYLYYTATNNGAFYATKENGAATFGTLPVAQGGTGATTAAAALTNLGLTATAAELNIMDGVTATTAEINKLDGLTATTTELNYVDGVTSAIQTQLDGKADAADHMIKTYTSLSQINLSDSDMTTDVSANLVKIRQTLPSRSALWIYLSSDGSAPNLYGSIRQKLIDDLGITMNYLECLFERIGAYTLVLRVITQSVSSTGSHRGFNEYTCVLRYGSSETAVAYLSPFICSRDIDGFYSPNNKPTPDEIGASNNDNLLDNWYWLDPINSRGQTSYTGSYAFDRWHCSVNNDTIAWEFVEGKGIKLTNSSNANRFIRQRTENGYLDGTYTLSVLVTEITGEVILYMSDADGNTLKSITITTPGLLTATKEVTGFNRVQCTIRAGASITISAIKLERGSVQTLAHQDTDGNWVINDPPPNKYMETLKCIQSTAVANDTYANHSVYHSGNLTNATQTDGGLMSAKDKQKLDGITEGAWTPIYTLTMNKNLDDVSNSTGTNGHTFTIIPSNTFNPLDYDQILISFDLTVTITGDTTKLDGEEDTTAMYRLYEEYKDPSQYILPRPLVAVRDFGGYNGSTRTHSFKFSKLYNRCTGVLYDYEDDGTTDFGTISFAGEYYNSHTFSLNSSNKNSNAFTVYEQKFYGTNGSVVGTIKSYGRKLI